MYIHFCVPRFLLVCCLAPGVFSILNYDITTALQNDVHRNVNCRLKFSDKKQTILSEAFQRANEVITESIGVLNMERYPKDVKWRTDRFKAAFGEHAEVEKVKATFEKLQHVRMDIVKIDSVADYRRPDMMAFPIVIHWNDAFTDAQAKIELKHNFFNDQTYCKESRAHLLIATAVQLVLRTTNYVGRNFYMLTPIDLARRPKEYLTMHLHSMYPDTEIRGEGPYPPMPLELVGARSPRWLIIRDKVQDMERNPGAYWVYAALVSDRMTILNMLRPVLEAVQRAFTAWWKRSNQVAMDIEMHPVAPASASSSCPPPSPHLPAPPAPVHHRT